MKLNVFSYCFFSIFFLEAALALLIDMLEYKQGQRLARTGVPGSEPPNAGDAEPKILARRTRQTRLTIIRKVVQDVTFLALLLSGLVVAWAGVLDACRVSFPVAAVIFFLGLWLIFYLLELPLTFYRERILGSWYGDPGETSGRILKNWFKGGLSWLVVIVGLTVPTVCVIRTFPASWWAVGWLIALPFQFYLTVLYPALVEPLSVKLEPLEDSTLTQKINALTHRCGLKNMRVYQLKKTYSAKIPAAFCAGLGITRRIVLPEMIMQALSPEETLAIIAHELGHLKHRHILFSLALGWAVSLLVLYLSFLMLDWNALYEAFNFQPGALLPGLFVIGVFWRKVGTLAKPLYVGLLRRFELQADGYAIKVMGTGHPLATALTKLSTIQGTDTPTHPVYAWFHLSHPPLYERTGILEGADGKMHAR